MPSIADISTEWGDRLYAWGWWISICAAGAVLIGALVLFVGTSVRDRDAESERDASRQKTAVLEVRAEELRRTNLELQTKLAEIQKNVRGREITDQQHDQIIAATKGMKVPDLVTYIARDPEALRYGVSLVFIFQEIGMPGRTVMMQDAPPMQTGVMYCGAGTPEDAPFMKVLMDAGIVGVGSPDVRFGQNKDGKEIVLPYCPRGSVFVGLRDPLSEVRSPRLKSQENKSR